MPDEAKFQGIHLFWAFAGYERKLTRMISDLLRSDLKLLHDPKSAHTTNS